MPKARDQLKQSISASNAVSVTLSAELRTLKALRGKLAIVVMLRCKDRKLEKFATVRFSLFNWFQL